MRSPVSGSKRPGACQVTGSASSYARKYALGGLLAIDDNKDPDTMDNREEGGKPSKSAASPVSPATPATDTKPVITKGDDLWDRAISYCVKSGLRAEALRKWYVISDADAAAMNERIQLSTDINNN